MSKHTPGPWVANTDAHGRGRIYGAGNWLATTWIATGDGNNAPQLPALANARLIAAAPDLLEALVELSKSFIGTYVDDPRSDNEIDLHRAFWEKRASAAIAKATGDAA